MTFQIPFTFIPGTKAKASEVNSNFSKIIEYLSDLKTSILETVEDFATLSSSLSELSALKTRYSVNSSSSALMTKTDNAIYFSNSFVITDLEGVTTTITNLPSKSTASLADGTYNIFVDANKNVDVIKGAIYRQVETPSSPVEGDVWVDTSSEPISVKKYTSGAFVSYSKIPLGNIVIASGIISKVTSFPFNQNGYNVNTNSHLEVTNFSSAAKTGIAHFSAINYSAAEAKDWGTTYQAASDGYLFARGYLSNNKSFQIDVGPTSSLGVTAVYSKLTDTDNTMQFVLPMSKGYYYKVSGNGTNSGTVFYPVVGAN